MANEYLAGQKYNKYTLVEFDSRLKGEIYWLCKCDCGVEKVVNVRDVRRGKVKSCGCLKNRHIYENLVGQKFNRYLVQSLNKIKNWTTYWNCLCDCGNSRVVR